jgi:nucleotide-binding universal stress UspA family protein
VSERLKKQGISVGYTVAEGDPAKSILKYAEEEQVNLIVMCTHVLGGLLNWVFGSVPRKVLDRTGAPVLIMRHTHN